MTRPVTDWEREKEIYIYVHFSHCTQCRDMTRNSDDKLYIIMCALELHGTLESDSRQDVFCIPPHTRVWRVWGLHGSYVVMGEMGQRRERGGRKKMKWAGCRRCTASKSLSSVFMPTVIFCFCLKSYCRPVLSSVKILVKFDILLLLLRSM